MPLLESRFETRTCGPESRKKDFLVPLLIGILLLGWHAPARAQTSQTESAVETGTFLIRSGEKQLGTEKFAIRREPGGWEVSGELGIETPGGGQVSETCVLQLDGGLAPTYYQREQRAPKKGSLNVRFGASEVRLASDTDAGSEDEVFFLSRDNLVVLDTNFFHHYALLVRRYDSTRGGAQQFPVFVPQEATPGTITLTLQGKENVDMGGAKQELNRFRAATEDVQLDIWATPKGEVQRISIPQASVEVTRQE